MQTLTADDAAALIRDSWTVVPGGFGCCGHPEAISAAIGRRFQAEGHPRNLTLLFGAGSGDRDQRGINHLARDGLVARAIGGFWGFAPALGRLAKANRIEAHNWPQGVVSQLFRAMAAELPGVLSRAGLGTFIDPDQDGGCLNECTTETMIRKVTLGNETFLLYPRVPVDCAIIRGTRCDERGNLTMERDISFQDGLAQAQAAHNAGGIVIAQVEEIVPNGTLDPHDVKVPGVLIDYVVVAEKPDHPQTYGTYYDDAFVTAGEAAPDIELPPLLRRIIAGRALQELKRHPGAIVNLGIGMPAEIGPVAAAEGYDDYTLTVESGQFGGIPATGLSFGASRHPQAVIEQSSLFDFYDGGGLDMAFLGFAQADSSGHVNVSHFSDRMPGIGGFANIARAARNVTFCGAFSTDGLEIRVENGRLKILREGRVRKFVQRVDKISFNGQIAAQEGRAVTYVTERAVFRLTNGTLRLAEVAPGIDIERDIIRQIDAAIVIDQDCREMDPRLFQ